MCELPKGRPSAGSGQREHFILPLADIVVGVQEEVDLDPREGKHTVVNHMFRLLFSCVIDQQQYISWK